MVKTFKDQELIEVERVDSAGDFIPREVMEKAIAEAQERINQGTPLLITKKFSGKLGDTQGMVTELKMEGNKVFISGTILDTDSGLAVQEMMDKADVEYAMGAVGVPEIDPETQVRTYKNLYGVSVAAVPAGGKTK